PADQQRLGQLRDLLTLLRTMGIEVHQADRAFTLAPGWPPKKKADAAARGTEKEGDKKDGEKGEKDAKAKKDELTFPAGSFVIRLDQPYSRMADALLDTQYVLAKEQVYDDTGWSLPYSRNVEVSRIVNPDVLQIPIHAWDGHLAAHEAKGARFLAIRNRADTDLIRLRTAVPDATMKVLEAEVARPGGALVAGTVVVEASDAVRQAVAAQGSLAVEPLDAWPSVAMHDLKLPRIAILHTWLRTQDEGWYRLAFDDLKVPYSYLSTQTVSHSSDLRAKFDVIVFPPVGGDTLDIVNGLAPGPPLPWKKTELTPNLGVDETDDMRPGLGLTGVANLARFVEEGGVLITARDTAAWAVQFGLARYVSVVPSTKLKARGSILRARVTDAKSPIAFGYDETVPVQYTGAPIFRVGNRQQDGADGRPSGRGGVNDPDVPQGRPYVDTPEKPKPGPGEDGFVVEDGGAFLAASTPRIEDRPRVILSFPKETDKILLAGMLEGAEEIAGAPVLIDSPRGKGHVLLFACNPMWRVSTQGDYALVFNAIWNAGNLGLGWPPAAEKKETKKETKKP
ncbi:MAG TPA: hypothetical protein VGE98_00630, partial [Thermoanaerobaculia bacterium]